MDFGWFAGLIGFAFAMAATPGPNNTMVTASGATYGMARTLPLVSGIAIGVAAIMLIGAAFGASLVADPRIGVVLKWIGVVYLLWLAWKIASAEPEPAEADTTKSIGAVPLSFMQGVLFQFMNAKLWVIVSGAVVTYGRVSGETGHLSPAVLFALVFGTMSFVSTIAWAALGASIGRLLASRRAIRAFNVAMAALLVSSLIPIIVE